MSPTIPANPFRLPHLLAYVAQLEVEVDRLRRHRRLIYEATSAALTQLRKSLEDGQQIPPAVEKVASGIEQTLRSLRNLEAAPSYHPADDQVVAIAVRPLLEQVFRWHKRLAEAPTATLQLELGAEHVDWFPGRLRYIFDNLISNGLKYRDASKEENWVRIALEVKGDSYTFAISDNGLGLTREDRDRAFDLNLRAAPLRDGGLGVGLTVVKLLVEQSGGMITSSAGEGQGSSFLLVLPRYELDDFLL